MLAAVLPWFVAIGLATHGAFFHDAIGGDLAGKLSSGDDAHGAPPGLHLLLMPLLVFPSSFAAVAALPLGWRARREPVIRFLLAWLIPCWLVFEAVPTKLPHYTLPLYPALCLLAARFCLDGAPHVRDWWRRFSGLTPLVASLVLAVGSVMLPELAGSPVWLGVPAASAAILAGWLAHDRRGAIAGLAAMPVLTLALLGWEVPHVEGLWIAPNIERAIWAAGLSKVRLGAAGFHEPSLVFLGGTDTDLLPGGQAGADALASGQDGAVIVSDRDEAAFATEARRLGITPHSFGAVTGLNYSRGRVLKLNIYGP
jgi:4-amino-4-deoxy-L-arabinose transferase-like glycosyltransferase